MAYELSIKTGFSSAHQLRNYNGNCENLHGHNWSVEVFLLADKLNEIGLVFDFRDLKKETNILIEQLDHIVLNDHPDFTKENPSAENIAKWIYKGLNKKIAKNDLKISKVIIGETEGYYATYFE